MPPAQPRALGSDNYAHNSSKFLPVLHPVRRRPGLGRLKLRLLSEALANPSAPSVIWLIGSACTGCSVSFLNRISDKPGEPADVAEVVANAINLVFHPTIMGAAGETAVAALKQAYSKGNYVLVLEGAVPTAFDGHAVRGLELRRRRR